VIVMARLDHLGVDAVAGVGVGVEHVAIGEVSLPKDPQIPVGDVAKRLGVGSSTLNRHPPGGRGGAVIGQQKPSN
jgi:hypothetical protein